MTSADTAGQSGARNADAQSDARDDAGGNASGDARDDAFLSSVIARIEENLSDADYSVERLASDMCTSRGNLHRRIRAISGMTPSQMLKTARMSRACSLLANTELPLCAIAEKTGFCNQAYFTTVFKNTYGVTPGRWRSANGSSDAKNGAPCGGDGTISAR